MKKIIVLILLLTVSVFISSCQKKESQAELYKVLINTEAHSLNDLNTKKYGSFSMSENQYENTQIEKEKTEKILTENYTLKYLYSVSSKMDSKKLDYYYDEAADCQIAYSTTSGKLLQIVAKDPKGTLVFSKESILNTDSYFIWLKDVISGTFNIDIDDYVFDCRTYYSDGTVENSFISSDLAADKVVSFYYFEYAKYVGKYKSAEAIKLIVHPNGSINSIIHSEESYDSFKEVIMDEDKLNLTIEKTIYDIYSSKHSIKSYTVKSMVWQCYEGSPYLMCGVEIISTDTYGEDIERSVILAITP